MEKEIKKLTEENLDSVSGGQSMPQTPTKKPITVKYGGPELPKKPIHVAYGGPEIDQKIVVPENTVHLMYGIAEPSPKKPTK